MNASNNIVAFCLRNVNESLFFHMGKRTYNSGPLSIKRLHEAFLCYDKNIKSQLGIRCFEEEFYGISNLY